MLGEARLLLHAARALQALEEQFWAWPSSQGLGGELGSGGQRALGQSRRARLGQRNPLSGAAHGCEQRGRARAASRRVAQRCRRPRSACPLPLPPAPPPRSWLALRPGRGCGAKARQCATAVRPSVRWLGGGAPAGDAIPPGSRLMQCRLGPLSPSLARARGETVKQRCPPPRAWHGRQVRRRAASHGASGPGNRRRPPRRGPACQRSLAALARLGWAMQRAGRRCVCILQRAHARFPWRMGRVVARHDGGKHVQCPLGRAPV